MSNSVYYVGSGVPFICTDKLGSILIHTVNNSVAGSIPSDGKGTDLSIHDLEQLVYKVGNQQGLSTCTNSNMGGLYCDSKLLVDTFDGVIMSGSLFNSSLKLEVITN